MRALLGALAALAIFPATAAGGGFASVGISSLPNGTPPGEPWVVELTILQHGVRPLAQLSPHVVIRSGRDREVFDAKPVAPGLYRAEVVFPRAGRWEYEIDDGFTAVHSYAPVEIVDREPWLVAAVRVAGALGDVLVARGTVLPDGRLVFARMGCGSCHTFAAAASEGPIGPDLDDRLAAYTPSSLATQIVQPSGATYGMPPDFGERMTGPELQALVGWLMAARRT